MSLWGGQNSLLIISLWPFRRERCVGETSTVSLALSKLKLYLLEGNSWVYIIIHTNTQEIINQDKKHKSLLSKTNINSSCKTVVPIYTTFMNFAIKDLLISEPFSCMGTLLQNTRLAKIKYHFQELGSKSHFSVYYFSLSFLFP